MADLLCDYAWQHPSPAAVRAAGYVGVMRYLSHDPSKDITAAEATVLHAEQLGIGLVFETTANRAGEGTAAGLADRKEAEPRAAALGYPRNCPVFYAVDYDAAPQTILPYFRGVHGGGYPVGVYGSARVVAAVIGAGLATFGWQTEAWSGTTIVGVAHLYQRVKPTRHIAGATSGSYDENVVLKTFPLWTPAPAPQPHVDPTPTPVGDVDMFMIYVPNDPARYVVEAKGKRHLGPDEYDAYTAAGVKLVEVTAKQRDQIPNL